MSGLCPCLRAAEPGAPPFEVREVVEDYDGLAVGLVACRRCGATAALELLDWDARLERRIFRMAAIPRAVVDAFEAKGGRASCKLDQAALEIEALLAQRGPTEALVGYAPRERQLLALAWLAPGEKVPTAPWRECLPAAADTGWFERLGLAKDRDAPRGAGPV